MAVYYPTRTVGRITPSSAIYLPTSHGQNYLQSLTAALSFVGTFTNTHIVLKALTAIVSFIGAGAFKTARSFTALLPSSGSLLKLFPPKVLTAILSFVGNFSAARKFLRSFSATLFQSVGATVTDDSYGTFANFDQMYAGYHTGVGEVFSSIGGQLDHSLFYTNNGGAPTGNAFSKLYSVSGGVPNVLLATSDPVDVSTVSGFSPIQFNFTGANRYNLVAGTQYAITFEYGGGNSSNNIYFYFDSGAGHGAHGLVKNGSWVNIYDANFQVFVVQTTPVTAFSLKTLKALSATLSFIAAFSKRCGKAINSTLWPTLPDLLNEGFEGTGAPAGWGSTVSSGGVVDWDYATTPLVGSQSLRINSSVNFAEAHYLAGGVLNHPELWFKFRLKVETYPIAPDSLFKLTGGSTLSLTVTLASDGSIQIVDNMGAPATNLIDVLIPGQVYDIFIHAKSGSGSNAILEFGFANAGGSRPSSGTRYGIVSTGFSTGNITALYFPFIGGTITVIDSFQAASYDVFAPSGVLIRKPFRLLTAALSFIGTFTKSHVVLRTLTATLSFVGSFSKRTLHSITGILSFVGASAFKTLHALSATLSFVGIHVKSLSRAFTGSLSFIGKLIKTANKALTAALSFIGNLVTNFIAGTHAYFQSLFGVLAFVGTPFKRTNRLVPAASLSFVGLAPKLPSKIFSATVFSGTGATGVIDSYSETNRDSEAILGNDVNSPGGAAGGFGQAFTGNGQLIVDCKWYLRKVGSPSGGTCVSKIWTMTGTFGTNGFPGTLLATSDTLDVSTLTGSYALKTFAFTVAQQFNTVNGTKYVVTIEWGNGDATNYVNVGYDGSSGTHPGNFSFHNQSTAGLWAGSNGSIDMCFYVDGVSGSAAGLLTKKTNRLLSAILSFIGNIPRLLGHTFVATLSFIGALTKKTSRILSAVLSFIGNLATQFTHGGQLFLQAVAGTLSFIGSSTKLTSRNLTGALSFIGVYTKSILKSITGNLSFIGVLARSIRRLLTASLSFIGALARRLVLAITSFIGTLSFTGTISKRANKTLPGILSFLGAIINRTGKGLTAILSFVGLLQRTFRFARSSFTAAVSFIGSLKGQGGKLFAGSLSFLGTLNKKTSRLLASILSFVGNFASLLSHAGAHFLSVASNLNFVGTLNQSTRRSLAATLSFIGAMGKRLPKLLTAASSFIGLLAKRGTRSLIATLSFIGVLTTRDLFARALTATLNFTGAITKSTRRTMGSVLNFIGNLGRKLPMHLASTLSFAGNLFKQAGKQLGGLVSYVGTLTFIKALAKLFTASLGFIGTLARSTTRPLASVLAFVGGVNKSIRHTLTGLLSFIGTLLGHAGVALTIAFTATLSFTGSFFQRVGKVIKIAVGRIIEALKISVFKEILGLKIGTDQPIQEVKVQVQADTEAINVSTTGNPSEVKIQVPGDIDI